MTERGVLAQALNLKPPWYVERAALDPALDQLTIYLDFERGGTFTCGGCANDGRKPLDTVEKRWRHPDFLGYRTILRAPSPRVDCPACGVEQAVLPWTRLCQSLTEPFEEFVV